MTFNSTILSTNAGQPPKRGAEADSDTLLAEPKAKVQKPSFYTVVLLNDDYTPMDFVVRVLQSIYHKSAEEAEAIMMQVHNKGAGRCGVFTRDVAETKVDQTLYLARKENHPLQCVMEKE